MHKIKVGVLLGGKSLECEVSLNSGRTICDHIDTALYEVIPLFQKTNGDIYFLPWHFIHRGKTTDFVHRLDTESKKIYWDNLHSYIDILYIAEHGRYGEDGNLQGFLEILGIPYVGSKLFPSALGMDKYVQRSFLKAAGILVAQGYGITDIKELPETIGFPCIVKPTQEGSSFGISVVYSREELADAITIASTVTPGIRQRVLVEEYIEGMEFSCIIIRDDTTKAWKPLIPTEIVLEKEKKFFDYEQKYMPGRAIKHTPARCSKKNIKKIQDTCIAVAEALDFTTIARIDGFLMKDGKVIITDPNTFSGMDPASFAFLQAAELGISHTQLINYLIRSEVRSYNMDYGKEFFDTNNQNKKPKKRIGVFFGGNSNEKEISLTSGRNVVYKLSPHLYETLPIFVSSDWKLYTIPQKLLVRNNTLEIAEGLTPAMQIQWSELKNSIDFAFIALHGGWGENGALQGACTMLGIPYNGSPVLPSALCMNKHKTNIFLSDHGFHVPHNNLLSLPISDLPSSLSYPCIVKPHDDGCSFFVKKVHNADELEQVCNEMYQAKKHYALVEEFITGTELTVGIIGNDTVRALPPSSVIAAHSILSIEEKFLPGAGENQTPAPLPPQTLRFIQATIEHVYKTLGCKGYARVDCFYQTAEESPTQEERVVILEINTLPAMTPATCIFHQAAEIGLRPMEFIDLIIKLGFQAYAPQDYPDPLTTLNNYAHNSIISSPMAGI